MRRPLSRRGVSSLKTLVHVVHAPRGPAHLGAARCLSARLAVFAPNPAHRPAARAHDHAFGGHGPALQPLDALEQRAVGNPGGGKDAVALGQFGLIVLAMVEGKTHGTDADAGDYLIASGDAAHIGEGEAE